MAIRAEVFFFHVKGVLVKEDDRAAVRALVLDQAVAVLIVVLVLIRFVVVLFILVVKEERFLEIADVAVDLLDILGEFLDPIVDFLAVFRERFQRVIASMSLPCSVSPFTPRPSAKPLRYATFSPTLLMVTPPFSRFAVAYARDM